MTQVSTVNSKSIDQSEHYDVLMATRTAQLGIYLFQLKQVMLQFRDQGASFLISSHLISVIPQGHKIVASASTSSVLPVQEG